jgi:2,3-bisphosphoglycerate-independent phosphoglycerate mutase
MSGPTPPPLGGVHFALIILDGLGDRPHPDTGGISPVEAARTPNLDALVARGRLGQVRILGDGVAPESDAGVLALLGYDPEHDSPGRGVLEAVGLGVPLAAGDVAFRLNFATADPTGKIIDSRVGRSLRTEEANELARSLSEIDLRSRWQLAVELRPSIGHRGVLWLHPTDGNALSPEVSNSDPFYERTGGMGHAKRVEVPRPLPIHALIEDPAAIRTAQATNAFLTRAMEKLAQHPINLARAREGRPTANALLVRNAGALGARPLESFRSKQGMPGTAVTEMPVERGIARLLGLTDEYVGPMGADRDAALRERARVTRAALERTPFVYVHLKGPDEPGHDGNAALKKEIVEALDRSFFGPFLDGLDWSKTRVAVTADHATPCILRGHSDDPVPLVIAGARVPAWTTVHGTTPPRKFGERAAAQGELGTHEGADVLDMLTGRHALVPE